MGDILLHKGDYVFSYRVAGILVHNDKVLLQKPGNDDGYAFPGGHVAFGETSAETLRREFLEELGMDITVGILEWVSEIFFFWGDKPCHQVCLYYSVSMDDAFTLQEKDRFLGSEAVDSDESSLWFYWIPVKDAQKTLIYPENAKTLLPLLGLGVQHFVYHENADGISGHTDAIKARKAKTGAAVGRHNPQ